MRAFTFKSKLLLAMMSVVGAVVLVTLAVTQAGIRRAFGQQFREKFESQTALLAQLREERFRFVKQRALSYAKSIRLIAALNEIAADPGAETVEDLYDNARIELVKPGAKEAEGAGFAFVRLLDRDGKIIASPDSRNGLNGKGEKEALEAKISAVAREETPEPQRMGLLATPEFKLYEVVYTEVSDRGRRIGGVALGFPHPREPLAPGARYGVLVEDQLHGIDLAPDERRRLITSLEAGRDAGGAAVTVAGLPHVAYSKPLFAKSAFPQARLLCLYSLEAMGAQLARARNEILALGTLALAGALLLSGALSHSLSGPIRDLVAGTREIQNGNFAVQVPVRARDELGGLASSFNSMAEGLALKEKYRSVLDLVADKKVASELIRGTVVLGGETREVSVLFCDIRGFTALTQNMAPQEVIHMLNEHFTPLTRVVYEHHGVVDKFVGDLIMAVFGAPKSDPDDAGNAARCALRMIEERAALNESSARRICMGIGVATGPAVAGCMGSRDRLNYTVLGERVNLASRLCGKAGSMEVVIDQTTLERLGAAATAEPLPEMLLKGFSMPVQAHKLKTMVSKAV